MPDVGLAPRVGGLGVGTSAYKCVSNGLKDEVDPMADGTRGNLK